MGFANKILSSGRSQPQVAAPNTLDAGPESGVASAALATKIISSPPNPYVPGPCNVNAQGGGNPLSVVTVDVNPPPAHAFSFDVPVTLPNPARKWMITAISQINTGTGVPLGVPVNNFAQPGYVALSLAPFGITPQGSNPVLQGNEPFIMLFNGQNTEGTEGFSSIIGAIIEFELPIQKLYLQCSFTNNQQVRFSFAGIDNVLKSINFEHRGTS